MRASWGATEENGFHVVSCQLSLRIIEIGTWAVVEEA